MGVNLTPIAPRKNIGFNGLREKKLAFDISIELYQFLTVIRLPGGIPLQDARGNPTAHLLGLLNRVMRLISEVGVYPIFIFDGKPHPLKQKTLYKRRKIREKAEEEWKKALSQKDYKKAFSKAVTATRLTNQVINDAKRLLSILGIPWIQAPSDAEAQAAFMAAKGDVWAVAGKDYDTLLFGAPRLVRYITFTGGKYLPKKRVMRKLEPELIELRTLLKINKINRLQLVDLAILVGTDYNEGVRGIGPKRALFLLKKYGRIEDLPPNILAKIPPNYNDIRKIFLRPIVKKEYSIVPSEPDIKSLRDFLIEKGFSYRTINSVISRVRKIHEKKILNLYRWF